MIDLWTIGNVEFCDAVETYISRNFLGHNQGGFSKEWKVGGGETGSVVDEMMHKKMQI